jgi:hypothetical protein
MADIVTAGLDHLERVRAPDGIVLREDFKAFMRNPFPGLTERPIIVTEYEQLPKEVFYYFYRTTLTRFSTRAITPAVLWIDLRE